jgi:hypothetical protein
MKIKKIILILFILSVAFSNSSRVLSQQTANISLEEKIQESELIIIGKLGVTTVTGFANAHPIVDEILYGELPKDKELVVTFVETEGFEQCYNAEQKYIIFLGYPRIDEKFKRISFSLIGSSDTLGMEVASEELIIKVKELIKKFKKLK